MLPGPSGPAGASPTRRSAQANTGRLRRRALSVLRTARGLAAYAARAGRSQLDLLGREAEAISIVALETRVHLEALGLRPHCADETQQPAEGLLRYQPFSGPSGCARLEGCNTARWGGLSPRRNQELPLPHAR